MSAHGYEQSDGFFTSLVDSTEFTQDEDLLARWLVSQIRFGAKMRQGLLVEAHLALLLDAALPSLGTTRWDLKLRDGRLVEVKSFGRGQRINIARSSKRADVWIFVKKGEGVGLDDARYYVMTVDEMNAAFGARRSVVVRPFEVAAGPGVDAPGLVRMLCGGREAERNAT